MTSHSLNEKWFAERSNRYPFHVKTDGVSMPKPESLGHRYGEFIRVPISRTIKGRNIAYSIWGFETEENRDRFLIHHRGVVCEFDSSPPRFDRN